jgi:ABC-type taurine transport system substrate-binding protein
MNSTLRISTIAAVASLAFASSAFAATTLRTADFSQGPVRMGQAAETYAAAATKSVNVRTFDSVAKSGMAEPAAPMGNTAVRAFDFKNAGAVSITQDGPMAAKSVGKARVATRSAARG